MISTALPNYAVLFALVEIPQTRNFPIGRPGKLGNSVEPKVKLGESRVFRHQPEQGWKLADMFLGLILC